MARGMERAAARRSSTFRMLRLVSFHDARLAEKNRDVQHQMHKGDRNLSEWKRPFFLWVENTF
jgi:hypothetical protein